MRLGAAVVGAVIAALAATACSRTAPDPYAAFRQTDVEEVPGTFDWELHPVDSSFRPAISPEVAYEEVYGAGREPEAVAVLAQVYNHVGDYVGPPAWVFITPDTCFATAKGDLVSPGRSGNGCTQQNLYVQGVDATTGETLGGFSAFEPPDGWTPAREGTPPPVVATTQLGSTRLH
jgi:hypothetical protein